MSAINGPVIVLILAIIVFTAYALHAAITEGQTTMSPTTQIFNAYDLTTDNSATLEHRFTPWGSWHATTYIDGHHKEVMHDWLPSAAEAITDALQTFKDDDRPTTEQALETIVAMVGNPHYEVTDSGEGPFILDTEECDECNDERETN